MEPKLVRKDQLEHGDHIFAPRRKFSIFPDKQGTKRSFYIYCHHAIVIRNKGKLFVVAFTTGRITRQQPADDGTENAFSDVVAKIKEAGGRLVEKGVKAVRKAVNATLMHLGGAVAQFCDASIRDELVDDFAITEDAAGTGENLFLVYQYPSDEIESEEWKKQPLPKYGSPELPNGDKKKGGDIALLFYARASLTDEQCVKLENSFGKYDLRKWNCECFAAFCRTTTMTVEEVSSNLDELLKEGSTEQHLDLDELRVRSPGARSVQAELLLEGGSLFKARAQLMKGDPKKDDGGDEKKGQALVSGEGARKDDDDDHFADNIGVELYGAKEISSEYLELGAAIRGEYE